MKAVGFVTFLASFAAGILGKAILAFVALSQLAALSAACLAGTLFGDRVPYRADFTGGAIVGCGAKSTLGGAR